MKEEAKRSAPRPRPGATRCPFCHEDCEAEADACACSECLSRHHRRCWDESKGCASCRGTVRLEARAESRDAPGYGEAVDAWLRLALVYNAVLTVVTVLSQGTRLLNPGFFVQVALAAVAANLAFLAGPGLELVARRIGYRGKLLRWMLFVAGLVLAVILALVTPP